MSVGFDVSYSVILIEVFDRVVSDCVSDLLPVESRFVAVLSVIVAFSCISDFCSSLVLELELLVSFRCVEHEARKQRRRMKNVFFMIFGI